MQKTILLTGATDGIGLETAKMLLGQGHRVLLHGRNPAKLADVEKMLTESFEGAELESYVADLSELDEVRRFAKEVLDKHSHLDVLINNAGILKTSNVKTKSGLDVRFVVNTLAPYLLMQKLMATLGATSRVVNLSSAAQAPVDLSAFRAEKSLDDMAAYAQSKLAITMWSRQLGLEHEETGPMIVAVNPGSLLASKMVKEGFGVAGSDLSIGADILVRAALSDEFINASGQYFDNDAKRFGPPHPDALNVQKTNEVVELIEKLIA
ncbi:Oxidoreductase, short chain dehydrogenase/reductase family protein [Candidatus Terasakiella magnetica]|uniref:Oxidoreductase, short chain dehydrogenase/reductase family protein n=1 Tax=Candidatus Terasakiella magnetica TaxID=1867952 RepID=A0A1C3RFI7_9PROT|nr:SDR family NAD(P)-dependent oxidoreductase [Candidatus Terasakiella magnetica]SCA55974.1 Oxidoreductase, short chain dehydrogenase/reductase family protein [Candidatus Terasakiella magnetica]